MKQTYLGEQQADNKVNVDLYQEIAVVFLEWQISTSESGCATPEIKQSQLSEWQRDK